MADTTHVYAGASHLGRGTVGGIFRRALDDDHWTHLTQGLPGEVDVHAITVHPRDPDIVYIGTKRGPFRSTDRGAHWERLDFPDDGGEVWSILVHPSNPRTVLAGASPVAVFRSDDGGDHWRRMTDPRIPERVRMGFACRVMRMAADAGFPDEIFATVEVNGAMRSHDRGESWEDCSVELAKFAEIPRYKSKIGSDTDVEGMLDGHALCVSAAQPHTVFLAVRMGLFRSDDRGNTWRDLEIGKIAPFSYARDVRVSAVDPHVMYACISPAARSDDGSIYRSPDLGASWQRFDHSIRAEATMMAVAPHPRDPDQVYAVARSGQVFGTRDGGRTWSEYRLPDACRDIYAVACG